jgi:Zn-dependent protease with chaperone function
VDFFRRQAEARGRSRWLIVAFLLGVVATVLAVDVIAFVALSALGDGAPPSIGSLVVVSVLTASIIGLASLYKTAQLRSGGGAVARSLGGERVDAETADPLRRRLVNVVEEMAIASGVPMPEVYVLERETGINAFAAGSTPSNAAIGITRGALEQFNRAELQGVIAHEFSHILNGDMRLNTRLIGLLFGLLVIALIARIVLRVAPRSSGGGNGKGGAAILAFVAAAMAVYVVGYVGLLFGRLIQAWVSRTRETLADASAVQFTRDPQGLRNALVKVGALAQGSRLVAADGQEVSHMLFAAGVKQLFASHPPLLSRIRAIDATFDAREIDAMRARLTRSQIEAAREAEREVAGAPGAMRERGSVGGVAARSFAVAPAAVADLVGNPHPEHVDAAEEIRPALPAVLASATRDPRQAAALFLALAVEADPAWRDKDLAAVGGEFGAVLRELVKDLVPLAAAMPPEQRIPALSAVFPALRRLSDGERERLLAMVEHLLSREARPSIFGYALRKLSQVHLRDAQDEEEPHGHRSLAASQGDLQVLFSVLAAHGHAEGAAARAAYESGLQRLLPGTRPAFARIEDWPAALDASLERLDELGLPAKEALVEALARTISHDGRMTVAESELLRAVCGVLHCPLPPLFAQGRE